MGDFIKKYLLEFLLFIFGALVTIACALWLKNTEAAVLSATITISSDTILFSVQSGNRATSKALVSDFKHFFMEVYMNIKQDMENIDERWKDDAYHEIESTRARIKQMATGVQNIGQAESIIYQEKLLLSASHEVLAIHLGVSKEALLRWDPQKTSKDFSTILIDANEKCTAKIKKRLFVIENTKDIDYLKALYTALTMQKKLSFETKVIYFNTIRSSGRETPQDMLICDKCEVVIVNFIQDQVNATAYVTSDFINKKEQQFVALWNAATVVDDAYLTGLSKNGQSRRKH